MWSKEKPPPTKPNTQASKTSTNPKTQPFAKVARVLTEPTAKLTPKPTVDVDIDADGDTLLLVGGDEVSGKPCKRLRVSYTMLSKASPVFKDKLDTIIAEDVKLNKLGMYEMTLADDDADAMEAICSVLHFCPETETKAMSASVLFQVAKLCKKYACQTPLKHSLAYWFEQCLCVTSKDHMTLFAASLVLDDVDMSRKFLKQLLLTTATSMVKMDVSGLGLKPGITASLESIRLELLHEVRAFIDNKIKRQIQFHQTHCAEGCNASALEGATLVRELASQGLWPTTFGKVGLSYLLEQLKHLCFERKPTLKACKGRDGDSACVVGTKTGFSEKLYHAEAARILGVLEQKVKAFQF